MEVEHLVGIGIALVISLILMWVVWSYFCQDKSGDEEEEEEQSESGETGSFSSTYVITRTHKKGPRRTRETSFSSCNDATTEEESEAGENNRSRRAKPRRKSKKSRTASYLYQKNNYGLADPFSEWAPSQHEHSDRSKSPQVVYPKSPVLKHQGFKKDHSVVDM